MITIIQYLYSEMLSAIEEGRV